MVINNKNNINSINPCKVRLPNSKIFNIKGTDFKYKIHYDQLNDTVVLRIEEQVNYIFNAYKKRYTLPIDADVTFEGYIYNNLEEYFYAYPQHQRIPGGGYIGGHSIGLSQYMPYKDHMQWLLAHEIAHSLNYYNLKNHNIPILKCSHEGHDDATDFGNEVGTEISLLSQARQSEYDRKLSTAVQSEDISEVTDFLNKDDSGKTPFEVALEDQRIEVARFLANAKDKYGKTMLHYAARDNNLNLVTLLIDNGADFNIKDNLGKTPLHHAVGKSIAKLLIERGANINVKDNSGKTPFEIALEHQRIEVANFLANAKDKYGKTMLHYAAKDNDLNLVGILIDRGAVINAIDNSGKTPLHTANGEDIAKLLIENSADVNARNDLGETPLYTVADKNVAKLLIENGADVNAIDYYFGETPLHKSISESVAKLLIENGADVNARNDLGETPLHKSISESHVSVNVAKLLIDKGADVNARDYLGKTLLHKPISESVAKLLIENGADINARDYIGETPFETAVERRATEVANLLATAKDKYSKTMLHYAAEDNNLNLVTLLVESGANISAKDKNGKTPLGIAIDQRHDSVAVYLQQTQLGLNTQLLVAVLGNDFNKVKDLVSKGASVDTKDNNGWTLLHHTAKRGYLEVAEFLIEKGADINAEDKYGKKPIQRAAEENNTNIITLLLSKGVNIDDTDRNGRTSLYWASWSDNLDAVKYLIGKGASIHAGDKYSTTPLDIARDKGHNNTVNYLEEKLNQEREKPLQRKRRHHHGDHDRHHVHLSQTPLVIDSSNQPEIAASSGTRASSWINDLFCWVKSSVGGLFGSRTDLTEEKLDTKSSISQPMDVNGIIMLLDVLVRKVTGQKYISTVDHHVSLLEAQGYALNITEEFEKVVEQAAKDSKISMHRLNIDSIEIQKEITKKIIGGKFNEISGILKSYVEKACPDEEAGKLSPKKFEKFIAQFNKGLLNQSIEQILHNRDGTLEVDGAKQMSLEPQSYLSNASVQGHLTRDKVKLIS